MQFKRMPQFPRNKALFTPRLNDMFPTSQLFQSLLKFITHSNSICLNTHRTMMKENPNTFSNLPSRSPLSYSIGFGMRGQSKLTIKISKLMVKTTYIKFHLHRRPRAKRGKNRYFTAKGNNLMYENQSIVGPLYQLLKLEVEDILEPHGRKEGKHPLIALSSFLDQKKGWNFFKSGHSSDSNDDVVTSWRQLRMKVRSWGLVRAVSKLVTSAKSKKNKVRKQFEDDRSREELCLCKKRILMGERCKPLHSSGTLQYDSDGILIPDIV